MRTLIYLALAGAALAGCAQAPTRVDASFGSAVLRARAAQAVDPDAPLRARGPMHLDGPAAKSAIEQYEKSFEAPTLPPAILNIGVGSGASGGGYSR
ncbi:MAG TPA: hypothetical protein VFM98_12380 [Ramlibacter sp.]|uniref:hypothetical protein n=1 Tax=Ramlibacter sp. TaxID=1917967 RepID=UPI002D7EEFBB|nr:hypothetical protein [Ramlibacter sp.]HET8746396.1 hypothetical protein [Ramlibacter sp.]